MIQSYDFLHKYGNTIIRLDVVWMQYVDESTEEYLNQRIFLTFTKIFFRSWLVSQLQQAAQINICTSKEKKMLTFFLWK